MLYTQITNNIDINEKCPSGLHALQKPQEENQIVVAVDTMVLQHADYK